MEAASACAAERAERVSSSADVACEISDSISEASYGESGSTADGVDLAGFEVHAKEGKLFSWIEDGAQLRNRLLVLRREVRRPGRDEVA